MIRTLGLILASYLILVMSQSSAFATDVKLSLVNISQVQEANKPYLPYNRLIHDIELKTGLLFDKYFFPTARAYKVVNDGTFNCAFPADKSFLNEPSEYVQTQVINSINTYIFTLDKPIYSLEDLTEQPVLVIRGYSYSGILKHYPNIKWFPVKDADQAFNLLKKKRAIAYIDYLPDLKRSLSLEQFNQLVYAKDTPLTKTSDRFVCRNNQTGKEVIEKISLYLEKTMQTGEINTVLESYYFPLQSE